MSNRAIRPCDCEGTGPSTSQRQLALCVVGCLFWALTSCQRDAELRRELMAPVSHEAVAAESLQSLPDCPVTPYRTLQTKDPATGHHRVFLKWYPSTSGAKSDPKALGYCLYRTQEAGRAKDCPTKYHKCEQINIVPVFSTRCVDELVRDNTTYYYVALAITSSGTSTTSEEAIAEVPVAGKQNAPPVDASSYPACRMPPGRPPVH